MTRINQQPAKRAVRSKDSFCWELNFLFEIRVHPCDPRGNGFDF
jgi:hypothetical protein